MADEMINKSKPYNKSSGLQGIGDTVKAMNEYDMNMMNDPIASMESQRGKVEPGKFNKNS
jgi:hypothetical protein